MYKMDDNLSPWLKGGMSVACFLSFYSGLSFLLKYLLLSILQKKKLKNEQVVCFVFSFNHEIVRRQLADLGIQAPVYDLSFKKTVDDIRQQTRYFSSILLFLAALANAKVYLDSLNSGKNDAIVRRNNLKVFKLCGYQLFFEVLTEDCQLVMKFNDHVFNSALLYEVCARRGVKTVYIQHAPVSPNFPALHHDLNVLFSQDSKNKYRTLKKPVKVLEFFDIRLLASQSYIQHKEEGKGNILIAVNKLDDMGKLKTLVKQLSARYQVHLRPHPRDKRDFKSALGGQVRIKQNSKIWEDMNLCEIVLSNESAVPLEALYYGRRFYKIAMISESLDNYGFLKNGLITEEFTSSSSLIEAIEENKVCVDLSKLSYYIGDMKQKDQLVAQLKKELKALMD